MGKKGEKRGLDDDAKLVCDSGMVSGNLRKVGMQVAAKSNQRRGAIKGTKRASLCFSPQLGQKARSGGVFFSSFEGGREELHVTREGDCKRGRARPSGLEKFIWGITYGHGRMK